MTGAGETTPWTRERDRILALLRRVASNEEGPIQSVLIDDPPGYGAGLLLDMIYSALGADDRRPARLPSRHDVIYDWPSLAIELLAAAHAVGAPHGAARDDLLATRAEFGPIAFRDDIDERITKALTEHGRLTVLIPNLNLLLAALDKDDHWAFRNVLQSYPLAVIATAPERWRPGRDEAFYEFFRRTRLKGYEEEDLSPLIKTLRLDRHAGRDLAAARLLFEGRPALVEAAAAALALGHGSGEKDILRHVAHTNAPMLHEALAGLANQTLRILAETTALGPPVTSGAVSEVTGLASGAVSTQLSRLEEAGMLAPDKKRGRNRKYDFVDPVVGALYAALVGAEPRAMAAP